jgi:hypothetical protein
LPRPSGFDFSTIIHLLLYRPLITTMVDQDNPRFNLAAMHNEEMVNRAFEK